MLCADCNSQNRDIAKYCKKCGVRLGKGMNAELDSIVGMDDIKKMVTDLAAVMQAVKNDGLTYSDRLHTVIMGNTGTGKTVLLNSLTALFHKFGVIKKDVAICYDAVDFSTFSKNFQENFKNAKGGILCIENVQKLIPTGYSQAVEQLDCIIREMSKNENRLDPIIFLSGQPQGFREYLNSNDNVKSKFRFIFNIPDFDSNQLAIFTEDQLKKTGFSLHSEASEKLRKVFQYILKKCKLPDYESDAKNAWLALKQAEEIKNFYYLKSSKAGISDKMILAEDIKGDVDQEKSLEKVLSEFDALVGMQSIKAAARNLIDEISIQRERTTEGVGKGKAIAFHIVLTGNPGTGKTTVARKLGELLKAIGVLDLGHVIEVDRSKIVAQYVGQTAPQVNKLCDDALGGILFIDEAYTLKQSDSDSYGQEAIDTLLKRMEDDRGKFIVVIAGYPNQITTFLSSNPGLLSRFDKRYHFHLDDYTPNELYAIFSSVALSESYSIDDEAKELALKQFASICSMKDKNFGNGREARNLFEECRSLHARRISTLNAQGGYIDKTELTSLRSIDIPVKQSEERGINEILKQLENLIGLDVVKSELQRLINFLQVEKVRSEMGGKETKLNLHFVFRGNPGTGKTTVARILADIFKSLGLLSKGHLVEVDRSGLVAQYLGQTAPKTQGVIDSAIGGILFIDEAYTLAADTYGKEAIDTLLKRIEDDKGKFIVIAAGYFVEMESFLNSNSGLTSRFTKFIDFDDYTPVELTAIFTGMLTAKGMQLESSGSDTLDEIFTNMYDNRDSNFANGRTVRNIFEKCLQNQSSRISPMILSGKVSPELLNTITIQDLTG